MSLKITTYPPHPLGPRHGTRVEVDGYELRELVGWTLTHTVDSIIQLQATVNISEPIEIDYSGRISLRLLPIMFDPAFYIETTPLPDGGMRYSVKKHNEE